MISYKNQRLLLVLTLFFSTMFLYGCSGSTSTSSVSEATIRLEVRDITTKAPVDNVTVNVIKDGDEAPKISRQGITDSRGKVTIGDLPPDARYDIKISKDGYQRPSDLHQEFVPDITLQAGNMLNVEQGKTYDIIGYMLRADTPATGTIKGYVKNATTGEPITNATVYVLVNNIPKSDTTDKPSKPGYYELSNIPTNATYIVNATVPGNSTQGSVQNVVVPANSSIDCDIMVVPDVVTINGTIVASASETLPPGDYVINVLRNGTETIASKKSSITATTQTNLDYTVENVPIITTGSTSTYTVKVVSDMAHMVNPAGGVSGLAVRNKDQKLAVPAITMMPEKGTLLITLYHKPILVTDVGHVSEATMSTQAPQAALTVEGGLIESMFVNEGPTRFYRYRLNNVPVGKRKLKVNFPGHSLADQDVSAIKDSEVSYLFTLGEGS